MSRYVFCADFFGIARKLRFIFIKIKPCSILIFETKFIFLVSNLYHNIKLSNKFDWFFFSSQFWLKICRGQNFHRYMISNHFRAEKSIFLFLIFFEQISNFLCRNIEFGLSQYFLLWDNVYWIELSWLASGKCVSGFRTAENEKHKTLQNPGYQKRNVETAWSKS